MKIFLSGKVDEKGGKWRDSILGENYVYNKQTRIMETRPKWALYMQAKEYPEEVLPWHVLENAIMKTHDYAGPYRQIVTDDRFEWKHYGYFHGVTAGGSHGMMMEDERRQIVAKCKFAIGLSDMVFAYINSPDCFGTLAEIGYAVGLGKFVSVVINPEACWDAEDYWFVGDLASVDFQFDDHELAKNEGLYLRTKLLESISKKANWVAPDRNLVARMASSLYSIQKWTADPRVRAEAEAMLRELRSR